MLEDEPQHMIERRVRIIRYRGQQAVLIPRELELRCNEAIARNEGTKLIITPAKPKSLLSLLARLKPITDAFAPIKDKPPRPTEL